MQCRMIAYIPGGYEKAGRIYDPSFASPTVQSRDYKDPIRVAIDERGYEEPLEDGQSRQTFRGRHHTVGS